MCTIKLYDVMEGKDFPMAGSSLYDIIRENMNSSDKITIDMEGVSSLPSMFLICISFNESIFTVKWCTSVK